ncbi:toxin of the RelE-RelB toxin-antitoxin system; Qin prophage (plasmid) [Legionella adelaidensis]|uniref:Toxin of the RelE-RelB toxin-antitoxin system Qin prophage n=1 Tax=Legionella adelaidensis TaxID=45056 RepID=A0A0W0R3S2_9GAMM|nr:type II toxin-antitoxin system RelE/ParE family toxin [Legionella adelaidensis]KTC65689.1 mRNA interferase RelE [Legionella adelaidensis]VEH85971.1 toxin of the RelE-RelB toxin-antitoxin system; Qin prophage [Legionella adelaidensis]
MTYKLSFHPKALEEWNNLDNRIKKRFKKKLAERLDNPHVPKSKLHGDLSHCYKIKLLKDGYRLVYQVNENSVTVMVVAVGQRDKSKAYEAAIKRLK